MSAARNGTKTKLPPYTDAESARMVLDAAERRQGPNAAERRRHAKHWLEVALLAVSEGEAGIARWLKSEAIRDPESAERCRAALDEARANPHTIPFTPPGDGEEVSKPFVLDVLGSAAFAAKRYPREYLISRILVAKRPTILAGPKKSLKTSLLVELVVSLSAAIAFLGEFVVPKRAKVLLISGESGEATIQETLRRVCKAKGIDPACLDGFAFWGFKLPQFTSETHLEALTTFIREHGIDVVILDPVYLSLMGGGGPRIDPASLFDVGPVLKRITDVCLEAGATPILAHHFRKNRESPFDPPELEDIAYGGFQEFARQWILVGRRKRYEPGTGDHNLWVTVGGSDGQSGEWAIDVSEGVTDENFSDRQWDVTIHQAAEARAAARAAIEASKVEKLNEKSKAAEAKKEADDRKLMDAALEAFGNAPDRKLTIGGLRKITGWRKDRADHIVARLSGAGVLIESEVPTKSGNGTVKDYPGFQLVEGVSQ